YEMPKIGHLCFPIAFFGHFQYTLTDQERIPHSPSGGDFHGKNIPKTSRVQPIIFIIMSSLSNKMGKGHGHAHRDVFRRAVETFSISIRLYEWQSIAIQGNEVARKGAPVNP
ncbi:hypothetical protein, partial [Geobacillus stearothermophilus]|uniref:hypothetical protein n=1 Tax=Geobacillus stearothermophilus TaxID=1422 RepID=UPI003D20579E